MKGTVVVKVEDFEMGGFRPRPLARSWKFFADSGFVLASVIWMAPSSPVVKAAQRG